MRRRGLSLIAGLAAVSMLVSACGSAGNAPAGNSGDAAESGTSAKSEASGENSGGAGGVLNLYTWDGMFPQEILDGFTKDTGIKIQYSNFEYDEDMLARLEQTGGGDYDIVIADDYILETVNQKGLAQKLDRDRIKGYDGIDPRYQKLFYDPEDAYDIPWGAGIPTIVYNPEEVDIEINAFGDLWDPSLSDNVAMIGNPRVVNGFTLMSLGYDMNTEEKNELEEAGKKLLELAPNIRAITDSNTQDLLLSGEAAAAFLYTSQATTALVTDPSLKQVYPSEGLGFGTMGIFIPSKAPNADAAYQFIDYLLDGQHAADCFAYMGYYSTIQAADAYLPEDMREYLVLPEGKTGVPVQNISNDATDIHTRIWTEFQKACGG